MRQPDREAYVRLMAFLEDKGYTIVEEEFSNDGKDPDFNVDLWLIPPQEDQ